MSELDELRRVAYGRTTSADDEAAAADARATLARYADNQSRAQAESEAAGFVRSKAGDREPGGEALSDVQDDDSGLLAIVDMNGEPQFLRRLSTTWRIWAAPAFASFVIGIVLTAASSLLLLREQIFVGNSASAPGIIDPGRPVRPGDLQSAGILLRAPQGPADLVAPLDPELDSASTHLVHSSTTESVYGAMSTDGKVCLIMLIVENDATPWTCLAPSEFVKQGLTIGLASEGETVMISWDGVTASESRTTS